MTIIDNVPTFDNPKLLRCVFTLTHLILMTALWCSLTVFIMMKLKVKEIEVAKSCQCLTEKSRPRTWDFCIKALCVFSCPLGFLRKQYLVISPLSEYLQIHRWWTLEILSASVCVYVNAQTLILFFLLLSTHFGAFFSSSVQR